MNLLLDTHIFIWLIRKDPRLSTELAADVANPRNAVFLSAASVWEAIIKQQTGKLGLPKPAASYLPIQRERHRIASLPVDENSVLRVEQLPLLHRDPFDRILVCQAQQFDLTIASTDP